MSFNSPLMMVCVYASMILIAWMGAQQIVASGNNAAVGLTTGDLTALVTYAMQILMAMMMLSMIFIMVIISQASAERICQVLQEESTVTDPANPVTDMADGSIEFDHVTFRYSDSSEKPVLDDINLKIRSGMTIGVVGGTGSAKSSLVQLVPRLYDVSSGSLKVGGVDVRDYDLEALRDQVAMVLQKNVLFSGTIAENLRWGNPNATDEEVRHAAQLAQADGFVQEFPDKYDTYIEQGGANVSGGQRQRLCIARALLKKPKILILDDSTSAVDTKTDKLIRNAFHNEIPDTTKIIIAQRVASVEESDMILVMDNGRIMASGTHDELLATCDEYRSIYESQTKNQARPEELVAAEPAGRNLRPRPRKERRDEQRPELQEPQTRHGQSRTWHHQAHLQLHLPIQVARRRHRDLHPDRRRRAGRIRAVPPVPHRHVHPADGGGDKSRLGAAAARHLAYGLPVPGRYRGVLGLAVADRHRRTGHAQEDPRRHVRPPAEVADPLLRQP